MHWTNNLPTQAEREEFSTMRSVHALQHIIYDNNNQY